MEGAGKPKLTLCEFLATKVRGKLKQTLSDTIASDQDSELGDTEKGHVPRHGTPSVLSKATLLHQEHNNFLS